MDEWEKSGKRGGRLEGGRHTARIRIRKRGLTAEGIPIRRTQIIHFNHDRIRARDRIPIAVVLGRQLPARPARWSGSGSWARAVQVLRHSHAVARIVVERASGCGGVAVWRSVLVAQSVSVRCGGGEVVRTRLRDERRHDGQRKRARTNSVKEAL